MRVSVTEAKGQLTELVRSAEAGEEVILTRHGHPAVRLVPIRGARGRLSRRTAIEAAQSLARDRARPGLAASESQDFLYGDDGMPA